MTIRVFPKTQTNTCYRIAERAMAALRARGRVTITIDKRLPVQGGLGAGSGNAVATLLALERALKKRLSGAERLRIAAEVGSDLPLFLVGGTVLGVGRGEEVYPLPDLPSTHCVVVTPEIGVSTPGAFADWDAMIMGSPRAVADRSRDEAGGHDFSRAENNRRGSAASGAEGAAKEPAELRSARTGPFDFAQGRLRPLPTPPVEGSEIDAPCRPPIE